MTREELKKRIKWAEGLNPNVEDGLLTTDLLDTAISDGMKELAKDVSLLPVEARMPMIANQYEYPLPADFLRMRKLYYINSDGARDEINYISLEQFWDGQNPTENDTQPSLYTIGKYQGAIYEFWAGAMPIYDYINKSMITTGSVRTVIDSGANFGKTLSGKRIKPGDVVHNRSDGSYGYVEVLDISTNKTTGIATSGTSTRILEDTGKNFINLGVEEGHIIATPSTGAVNSYAFVTAVTATKLTYADMQGTLSRFASTDTYKVGKATEIKLSMSTPHPGLRNGILNVFTLGTTVATLAGTTFTSTTCTCADTTGVVDGYNAVASGGSHGKIVSHTSTVITVEYWIGGTPVNGEAVTVKTGDEYQVEDIWRDERVLCLAPTPNGSDSIGTESIQIHYNACPKLPLNDNSIIEVDDRYYMPLLKATQWQVAILSSKYNDNEVETKHQLYLAEARKHAGDVWQPPIAEAPNKWRNRQYGGGSRHNRNSSPSGSTYIVGS